MVDVMLTEETPKASIGLVAYGMKQLRRRDVFLTEDSL
jgi:hypothetical protein